MTDLWPETLVLAGAGKMGGAMLRGWLAKGLQPSRVWIVDPYLDEAEIRQWQAQGITLGPPDQVPAVLVLAIKPQALTADAAQLAPLAGPATTVVSILAGKPLASLRKGLPQAGAIIRTMPNLPAAIGHGATGAAAEPSLGVAQREVAHTLLTALGDVEWLDESHMDAVTALSGSGPAYLFFLTECLAEAGIAAGLEPLVAARLARATITGAAALLAAEPERSPRALREAVTSPGGTTAAALAVLQDGEALGRLVTRAVAAAKLRASELAG